MSEDDQAPFLLPQNDAKNNAAKDITINFFILQ